MSLQQNYKKFTLNTEDELINTTEMSQDSNKRSKT